MKSKMNWSFILLGKNFPPDFTNSAGGMLMKHVGENIVDEIVCEREKICSFKIICMLVNYVDKKFFFMLPKNIYVNEKYLFFGDRLFTDIQKRFYQYNSPTNI